MKWSKENKEKISYVIALTAFFFGMGLTIAGFIIAPTGIVDNSVLWVLGQCLTYSGAVFGVGLYVNNVAQEVKATIVRKDVKNPEPEIKKELNKKETK